MKEKTDCHKGIEILAPAGSMESVYAAVRCGADAVYLGGTEFSARQNATNFSEEELAEAVRYCHLHNVKVHQAINTVMFDNQMDDALKYAEKAAVTGVDALIIQDLGFFSLVKKAIPEMPLHASTQMTIHTKEGALFAKEQGFSRVVVSRELSLPQIAEICKAGIEIEAFVHGALCMCVSGQCYMSAMIGSRSANRGLCAQACRLPFSVVQGENRCDLSLKDMSLVRYIEDLSQVGVTSFKIEGRMKRPEYVAAAVSACKAAVTDGYFNTDDLQAVFSRSGFTDGYINNKIDKDMFGVRAKEDVVAAPDVLPKLKELYKKDIKSSDIQFEISVKKDIPVILKALTDDAVAEVSGNIPQIAINRPTDKAMIEKQLSKLGDTVYNYGGTDCKALEDDLMIPASLLNDLRRRAVEEIDKIRIENNKPKYTICKPDLQIEKINQNKSKEIRIELLKSDGIDRIRLDNVSHIILPLSEINSNICKSKDLYTKIIAALPRFIVDEKSLDSALSKLSDMGVNKIYCNNVAHIEMARRQGFELYGGYGLNVVNSYSALMLKNAGIKDICLSFELKLSQISSMKMPVSCGIIAYGRLPLMLVRNCPIKSNIGCRNCTKTIYDRTGRQFRTDCDGISTEILNSDILYMADRLNEVWDVSFLQLKFYDETPEQINSVIEQYINGGNPSGNFTRGLYYRGIK